MWSRLLPIFLFTLFILAACTYAKEADPSLQQAEGSASPPVLPNLLVQVTGQIEVRRKGSTRFVPVALGAAVQPGDTLRLVDGEASIFCGNEGLWDASPQSLPLNEQKGVPCEEGHPPRPAPDLSGLRNSKLYALSPRGGLVMNERPTLRWNPVSDVQEYVVTLKSTDKKNRQPVSVIGHELPYPDEWDPLQADAKYRLEIKVEINGSESKSSQKGEFRLLTEKRSQIERQIKRLEQRPLDNVSRTLLLAELHLNYDLYSEAIELLQKADHNQIAVQRLLGETYLRMELPDEATSAYSQTLTLAQEAELPEEQATAHLRLSLLACNQADEQQANAHKQEAQNLYEQMDKAMDDVEALLAELEEKCAK
ncbi:MAG: tetratricopeptide repeat protein [Ardenticatenaceae bacterium]